MNENITIYSKEANIKANFFTTSLASIFDFAVILRHTYSEN